MKKKPILVLSWHPGATSIQTAGGFKRLYYILANTEYPTVVLDKYPSIYKNLENSNLKIVEYGKNFNLTFIEKVAPFFYKLLDRVVSFILMFIKVLILKQKIGVVYISFSELPHLTLLGVITKFIYGVPLVLCNLNVNTIFLDRIINRYLHRVADRVLTISKDLQKNLNIVGIHAKYINTVGFDIQPFINKKKISKKYDAIFVGRHIEEKGIFDLIQIWSEVNKIMKRNLVLITIGDIPSYLKFKLNNEIKKEGLTKKQFCMLGNVSDEEKINYYFASRLCIFPSHHEGWGITPIEALAAGIPAIVYDLPVYNESLAGYKGVVKVEEYNSKKFAREIVKLLDSKEDYSRINYEALLKNDWSNIAEKEIELITTA